MFGYLRFLPEFIWAIIRRWDTACGIAIGIGLVLVLTVIEVSAERTVSVTLAIMALLLLETTYGVYHQERVMRSKLEAGVRITARVGTWSQNFPDPGVDKSSLEVHLYWEMWAREEVATDRLALNLIYVYKKRWWQFWKKRKSPVFDMTQNGRDSTLYRRTLAPPGALQPDKDDGKFTWVGDRQDVKKLKGFELALVLVTGMPRTRYSIPITNIMDNEEFRSRGANPPL